MSWYHNLSYLNRPEQKNASSFQMRHIKDCESCSLCPTTPGPVSPASPPPSSAPSPDAPASSSSASTPCPPSPRVSVSASSSASPPCPPPASTAPRGGGRGQPADGESIWCGGRCMKDSFGERGPGAGAGGGEKRLQWCRKGGGFF